MARFGISPFSQINPYFVGNKAFGKLPENNAAALFYDSVGDRSISFHLKGELSGARGNSYKLMFNRISSSGPRWGIRIYDRKCNIFRSITLTLVSTMTALPAAVASGGLGDVLDVRVYKSVNEAMTAATCEAAIPFNGGS
jgi:hypothetical protein